MKYAGFFRFATNKPKEFYSTVICLSHIEFIMAVLNSIKFRGDVPPL